MHPNQNKILFSEKILKYLAVFFIIQVVILRTFVNVEMHTEIYLVNVMTWSAFIFTLIYLCLQKSDVIHYRWIYFSSFIFWFCAYVAPAKNLNFAMSLILSWFSDISLFCCCCYWARDKKIWNLFVTIILCCFCAELIYGLFHFYVDIPILQIKIIESPETLEAFSTSLNKQGLLRARIFSNSANGHFPLSNTYAMFLLCSIPIVFSLCCQFAKKKRSYFYSGCFILIIALWSLYLTKSRGAILSFIVAFSILLAIYIHKKSDSRRFFYLTLLISGILVISSVAMLYTSHFNKIGDSSLTFLSRIEYWKVSWKIFEQNYTGIGVGNFSEYFYKYKPVWLEETNNAHNFYIQYLIETGFLGLLGLSFFLIILLHELFDSSEVNFVSSKFSVNKFFVCICLIVASFFLWRMNAFFISAHVIEYFQDILNIKIWHVGMESLFFLLILIICICIGLKIHNHFTYSQMIFRFSLLIFLVHAMIDIDFYVYNLSQYFWLLLALYIAPKKSKVLHVKHNIKCFFFLILSLVVLLITIKASNKFEYDDYLQEANRLEKEYIYESKFSKTQDAKYKYYKYLLLHLKDSINVDCHMRIALLHSISLLNELNITSEIQNEQVIKAVITIEKHAKFVVANMKMNLQLLNSLRHLHITLSKVWQQQRNKKQKKKSLLKSLFFAEKALLLYPNKAVLLFWCGQIYEELKQKEKALTLYRKAIFVSDMVYPAAYGLDKKDRMYILALMRKRATEK